MRIRTIGMVAGFVGLALTGGAGHAWAVARPAYNQGVGFFVLDGNLYDANGNEFRIRGIDKLHWEMQSAGLSSSHANTVRWAIDFTQPAENNVALLLGGPDEWAHGTIHDNMVVMPGNWNGTGVGVENPADAPAALQSIVDTWNAQASQWTQLERYSIINIANEWGPADNTMWRDKYIDAITSLRQHGYHATIAIDSGGWGQDPQDIIKYGQAVFNADPEKNVIFDLHVYGNFSDIEGGVQPGWNGQPDLGPSLDALAATGLVIIVGEFGPGRNIGQSPTMITPTRVMQKAEQVGFGWMAWAWDDHDNADGTSDDNWFALSFTGNYNSSADLTTFGRTVVEGSPGLIALATPASIFSSGSSGSDSAQYSFESGTQGWYSSPEITLAQSSAQAFAGSSSLAANLASTGAQTVGAEVDDPVIPAGATVTAHVWCPSGAAVSDATLWVVHGGTANGSCGAFQWFGGQGVSLAAGQWTTLSMSVPSCSVGLAHVGVNLDTTQAWNGTCYIDSVSW